MVNHNRKVTALEKKNMDQETKHARMITMMDRVVDSQDNQLRHQKFEMGEQEKKFQQEMNDMKEVGVEQLREHTQEVKDLKEVEVEQERKHSQQLQEMLDIGVETAERLKVEHDAKVHKLEEDNKVLKSQVERFKVDLKETC